MYDWNDFLNLAFNILDDKSDNIKNETKYRIAISRAYYAAFHKAKLFYSSRKEFENLYSRGKGLHEEICNKFIDVNKGSKEFCSKCSSIGNSLTLLKKDRHQADYNGEQSIGYKMALLDCKKAKRIIDYIENLRNNN